MHRISLAVLLALVFIGVPAFAQEALVIATVNDQPVTSFDVEQRIRLLELLGQKSGGQDRHKIANALIDDVVKISEATLYKINPTEKDIDERLGNMAKNMKIDPKGLEAKLKSQGVSMPSMRQYIAAQMSFGRLLSAKFHDQVKVSPDEVDKKFATIKAEINGKVAKVMADPRRQPITVYSILQVDFPVDGGDPQLLQSRAIEVQQYLQKFKGCSSARAAASGIFNVKVGKAVDADAKKLPKPLKDAFDSQGVGHAVGPVRGPNGLQAIAFCGSRTLTPPKLNVQMPTRQQIENAALNEKFDKVEAKYMAIMRKEAVIEYKDKSYVQ